MTIELTYNQLKAPKQSMLGAARERLAEVYFGSAVGQFIIDLAFFIVGAGIIAAAIAVVAA